MSRNDHLKVAIYDGNEHVCGTCPTNTYGERVAWDQAHQTPGFAEREAHAIRAWAMYAGEDRPMSHDFRAGYHRAAEEAWTSSRWTVAND